MVYAWSKKFHNWLMWGVVILGGWMMLSGILMHKELEGEALLGGQAMLFMRYWHNKVSQMFVLLFGAQMLTGLLMWGVPKILRRGRE